MSECKGGGVCVWGGAFESLNATKLQQCSAARNLLSPTHLLHRSTFTLGVRNTMCATSSPPKEAAAVVVVVIVDRRLGGGG